MMSRKHQNILTTNRFSLVKNVKVTEDLLSCLMEDYTLTGYMKEEIEAETTSTKKVGTLLNNLMRREDTAFSRFVFALVETDQDGMARTLDRNVAEEFIATRNANRRAKTENEDTVDSKLEEERALAIINGHNATKEMIINVRLATNLHLADNHHQVYPMNRHQSRGRVLIINNRYFIGSKLKARRGAEIDENNLKQLFGQLSFTVEIHTDRTAEEMKTLLEAERLHSDHEKASMFILFILSHGNQGNVYGIDEKKLSIEGDITSYFTPEKAPSLAGKPKIFFIQACQGEFRARVYQNDSPENDAVSEKEEEVVLNQMETLKLEDNKGFVPGYFNKADVVMSYATVKGYLAWRREDLGSWFVRCLVHVFSQRAHSDHLLDMLTEVNSLLTKLTTNDGCGQLAEKSDTLTKKLYLFPGTDPRTPCPVSE